MKKFTKTKIARNVCMWGGVILSAILALSLTFASCDNPSDSNSDDNGGNNTTLVNGNNNNNSNSNSDNNNNSNSNNNSSDNNNNNNSNSNNDNNNSNNNSGDNNNNNSGNAENLSPNLPDNVGENPIKETIRFVSENDRYLELKSDGTARYFDIHNNEEETKAEFAYTYNVNERTISMKLKKYYDSGFEEKDLLTYDELHSKVNEYFSVENIKQVFKAEYEELQEDERFKEEYPDGISYEKWEREAIDWMGFKTLDEYAEYFRQMYEGIYKAIFGAQITYAYEINDGKMMLAEKFTGVKNLLNSECCFSDETGYLGIFCYAAYLHFGDDDGDSIAYLGTDNKTINFSAKNITATYTENLAKETVTISFDGKDYICEFYGRIFTQAE